VQLLAALPNLQHISFDYMLSLPSDTGIIAINNHLSLKTFEWNFLNDCDSGGLLRVVSAGHSLEKMRCRKSDTTWPEDIALIAAWTSRGGLLNEVTIRPDVGDNSGFENLIVNGMSTFWAIGVLNPSLSHIFINQNLDSLTTFHLTLVQKEWREVLDIMNPGVIGLFWDQINQDKEERYCYIDELVLSRNLSDTADHSHEARGNSRWTCTELHLAFYSNLKESELSRTLSMASKTIPTLKALYMQTYYATFVKDPLVSIGCDFSSICHSVSMSYIRTSSPRLG
jgi:hypothetical protein